MAIAAVALVIATLANFDRKPGRIETDSTRLMNGIFTRSTRTFRFVFFVVAALATLDTMSGGPTAESAFVVNGTQVLVGLLLAAIAATNSTARQFERNPMAPPPVWLGWPALKNVLANWLGPCRLVFVLERRGAGNPTSAAPRPAETVSGTELQAAISERRTKNPMTREV
jgi:hypothetical protein